MGHFEDLRATAAALHIAGDTPAVGGMFRLVGSTAHLDGCADTSAVAGWEQLARAGLHVECANGTAMQLHLAACGAWHTWHFLNEVWEWARLGPQALHDLAVAVDSFAQARSAARVAPHPDLDEDLASLGSLLDDTTRRLGLVRGPIVAWAVVGSVKDPLLATAGSAARHFPAADDDYVVALPLDEDLRQTVLTSHRAIWDAPDLPDALVPTALVLTPAHRMTSEHLAAAAATLAD